MGIDALGAAVVGVITAFAFDYLWRFWRSLGSELCPFGITGRTIAGSLAGRRGFADRHIRG